MRNVMKKPLTMRAAKSIIKKLNEYASDEKGMIAILDNSIEHNWQSVYAPKIAENDYSPSGADGFG
jgi:hypothetical protein